MLPSKFEKEINQIVELINDSNRIFVCAHLRPDGDATGSVSGLVKSLLKHGKEVEVGFHDPIPENFSFVFPEVKIYSGPEIEAAYDAILVLDSGDAGRTGLTFKNPTNAPIVNIDHHASNTYFGDLNYVDISASSACEMITTLLTHGRFPLDGDVALGLFLGLLTDSRSFQNEGVRHVTHLAAAKLLETGLDTRPILNTLNCGRDELDLRVQGFGLCNFKLECNNRLATLILSHENLSKMGATFQNVYASGIFNSMMAIKGVYASVVIFEREDGNTFCEFRSKGGLNVKDVAVSMGGGGHVPASGCNKNEPLETVAKEAITKMIAQTENFLKENGLD